MIFLHLSLHSTHILNLCLFSANLVRKIDMSYHAPFLSITYTMTLTPFDSFKFKWLNSHIFYDLCGCRDIGTQVGKHGYGRRQEERGNNSLLNLNTKTTIFL